MIYRILCISFIFVIASGLELNLYGLPSESCYATDKAKSNKRCSYTHKDHTSKLTLKCTLEGTRNAQKTATYNIQFGTNTKSVQFKPKEPTTATVSYEIALQEGNNTVKCHASSNSGGSMTIEVNVNNPRTTTTSTTTESSTITPSTESPIANQATQTTREPSDAELQTGDGEGTGWVKWALVGVVLVITIGVVVIGCIVMYRRKKPPPAESTYANMGKDLNTYQTMPVPAPRTIQPNATQKPNALKKPKVTMENNYSEPKDSQDMSEALYADPQRFNGDSETYTEPYIKSKPSPQSDTYAEPYKPNCAELYASISEGNYAELSLPNNSKDLYAQPIPKAQRKPKVKDESNYSNVFGDQYANTRN